MSKKDASAQHIMPEDTIGIVEPKGIVEEVQESYLDYAMSVIVARALPDVRDGMKPVHRRVLYAMWDMGLRAGARYRKSATVVGEVLGKYHPHGDVAVYDSVVRLAQDFSMRYPLVDGQGNFGCFTKDTKVKLTDGRNLNFGELIREYQAGKRHYTYTVNTEGLIAVAEIKKPRLTRKNSELVKVTLDNEQEIRCTPSHLFMLKNGRYVEAKYLRPDDSLMPCYQKLSETTDRLNRKGYTLIRQPKTNEWVPAHHLADNFNLNNGRYSKAAGRVRHHIDFNKTNNDPDNIVRLHWGEHLKVHYEQAARQHQSVDFREKIAQGRATFWSNPANRTRYAQALSQRNKENWQKQDYRKKMCRFLSDVNKAHIQAHPELREELSRRASKTLRTLWQNPSYRAVMREKIIKGNKHHTTNLTGKTKFLRICRDVANRQNAINEENYSSVRNEIYSYGHAPMWQTAMEKYFQSNVELVRQATSDNHKIVKVETIFSREDVYDLTIEGTHNFCLAAGVFVHNSMDGDNAAAMRYTEVKLERIAEEVLTDIEKNTVDFIPNYDESQKEPVVLPARLPNLLLNGTVGIAVGMATSIPPHNLTELCGAIEHLIEHPTATVNDLMEFVTGPDFPTGGEIYDASEIKLAYATGKGRIVMRATAEVEETKDGGNRIIVGSIPYQVNKAFLIENIANLVRDKKLDGIKDLRDESDREGVRIVIDLKRDSYPKKVLNRLFDMTQMQTTFHVNLLALVDGIQPRVLTLKSILEEFIKHRQVVVRRRTEFDLEKAKARAHILEGLTIALDHLDAVIKLIRASRDRDEAGVNLMQKFKLSELQANAILDMRLSQLANLERQKIEDEYKAVRALMKELEAILANPKKILQIIQTEMKELKEKYGDERRTKVFPNPVGKFTQEDLIPNESTIIMVTRDGYIKRLPPTQFKTQSRGGKGVLGLTVKEEDLVEQFFSTMTHTDLLFFTSRGRVFQLKAYEVPPAGSRTARGQALVNFLQLMQSERVTAILPLAELEDSKFLIMVTNGGTIKKVALDAFANVRRSGLIAMRLKGSDVLEWVKPSTGRDDVLMVTTQGQSIRFAEKFLRAMGRNASGVRGMRLKGTDRIAGMDIVAAGQNAANEQLLVVTTKGFGKRTGVKFFRNQGRGGSGIKCAKVTDKTGTVVAAFIVNAKREKEDLICISNKGQVIRLPLQTVSVLGRDTQGVRIMRFKEEGDELANVAFV